MRPSLATLVLPLVAGALAVACAGPARTAVSGKAVVPFVENDYDAALARARARDLPVFVEAWAPW